MGDCFRDWIFGGLIEIRRSSKEWPESLTDIFEQLSALFQQSETTFVLPRVAEGQLWWESPQRMSANDVLRELTPYADPKKFHRFRNALTVRERYLFRTTANDIGLGPLLCQPGDQVWVLENGRVPFVLRPKLDSFELMGECYLHGVMDGELLANGPLGYKPISLV